MPVYLTLTLRPKPFSYSHTTEPNFHMAESRIHTINSPPKNLTLMLCCASIPRLFQGSHEFIMPYYCLLWKMTKYDHKATEPRDVISGCAVTCAVVRAKSLTPFYSQGPSGGKLEVVPFHQIIFGEEHWSVRLHVSVDVGKNYHYYCCCLWLIQLQNLRI